ncbi:MAG: hypothetical protein ACI9D5_002408, partial [Candidatus Endobugula sp.]
LKHCLGIIIYESSLETFRLTKNQGCNITTAIMDG